MEAIASGSVVTVVDVMRFVQCTLLAATEDFQVSKRLVVCYCMTCIGTNMMDPDLLLNLTGACLCRLQ